MFLPRDSDLSGQQRFNTPNSHKHTPGYDINESEMEEILYSIEQGIDRLCSHSDQGTSQPNIRNGQKPLQHIASLNSPPSSPTAFEQLKLQQTQSCISNRALSSSSIPNPTVSLFSLSENLDNRFATTVTVAPHVFKSDSLLTSPSLFRSRISQLERSSIRSNSSIIQSVASGSAASASSFVKSSPSHSPLRSTLAIPSSDQSLTPSLVGFDSSPALAHDAATHDANSPEKLKTEMCRSLQEKGGCKYGAYCRFAHSREELRPVKRHPLYRVFLITFIYIYDNDI